MANLKITAAQIIALRSATMRDNGSYELTTAKGQTVNAFTRNGILVSGTRFLTVQGVSVMHSVSHVDVIASKGHTTYVSDSPESLEMFTLPTVVESDECTCSKGAPSPGNSPCLHCGGDNSWCAKHYPAPPVADGTDVRFPMVTIQGDYVEPRTMLDPEGNTIPYDAFLSMAMQDAARIAADGGCVGLCGLNKGCAHCDEQYGHLDAETDAQSVSVDAVDNSEAVSALMDEFAPMDRTGDGITSVMTVAVIQNTPGMAGLTHYHAPECRDIQREMRKYGQRPSDAFENGFDSVAEILEFEFGDIASDNAESNTPEWWAEIMYNANGDKFGGVKIMGCLRDAGIPNGETSDGSPLVTQGNFFRAGFKAPSQESVNAARAEIDAHNFNTCDVRECITCMVKLTEECQDAHTSDKDCAACSAMVIEYDDSARKFPCLKVAGVVLHKGACAQSHGGNGPVCSLDDDSDAGFVETDSTDDYAIVAQLTSSAGFNMITECTACGKRLESLASDHTCEESRKAQAALVAMEDEHMSTMATGTTHHSVDSQGGQWERFEHVLSVGDIVRSTETGRALYEVYALIPGLPVVYVDPCNGSEPFPMGATKLYAL